MAVCKLETCREIKAGIAPEFHGAVDKLALAGFDPVFIWGLIKQFGPRLLAIVEELIEKFAPQPVSMSHEPNDSCTTEFDRLEKAALSILCAANYLRRMHDECTSRVAF